VLLTGVGSVGFAGSAVDTSRVASQVVTGIGFIGAGVILKNRGSVKGLTTAGDSLSQRRARVAVSSGVVVPAVFATAVALLIIYVLRFLKPVIRRGGMQTVEVEYEQGHGTIGPLLRALQESGGSVEEVEIEDGEKTMRHVTIQVFNSEGADLKRIVETAIGTRPEVRNATVIED
jgi:putative Mg2+ transporter-C (MgtC) family protein